MAKGKVTINEVICKGCGLCVSVCPKSVLALSTTKINPAGYNPAEMINEDCIACTSCAKMCPDCAIVVERRRSSADEVGTVPDIGLLSADRWH